MVQTMVPPGSQPSEEHRADLIEAVQYCRPFSVVDMTYR